MEGKRKYEPDRTNTGKELTDKFLNGEITFTEYSERWDREGFSDGEDDDEADEGDAGNEMEAETSDAGPSTENQTVTVRRRRIRRSHQLPPALAGLMGEANLQYARGDHEMAEKMCYEIIRQMALAAEPYQTLAQIYEADPIKSMQFSLLAAHLNPSDGERWVKLAQMSKEMGDPKQEIFCLTKAINANPQYLHYHLMRLESVKQLEERKISALGNITVLVCQQRMMKCMSDADGDKVLTLAKTIARAYHAKNELKRACNAMDVAYKRFPDLFTFEDINLYLELLIALKDYEKCLHIFMDQCGIEIEVDIQPFSLENAKNIPSILNCALPFDLPIDIRAKFLICLIHLKNFHLVDPFIESMIESENVELTGDIYLDIEEALTSEGRHDTALHLLKMLVNSSKYSLPAVWLKYAECLSALNVKTEAIDAYKKVVELAPQHLDARIKLASLLKSFDRLDEALRAVEQDDYSVIYTSLLYEKCLVLKRQRKLKEYLEAGTLLMSRHTFRLRNRAELAAFRSRDSFDNLKLIRERHGEDLEDVDAPLFDESNSKLTLELEWNLLYDLLETACDLRDYCAMERLAFTAIGSKKFNEYKTLLEFICLLACYYNSDNEYAFMQLRNFLIKAPNKINMWNLLNLIIQRGENMQHSKFVMRFLRREESCDEELHILDANSGLLSGSYKYALKEYLRIYKLKDDPLSAMLTGITMIHIASQRHTTNKHMLLMQGFAFLSYYEERRGIDGLQEVYYNTGRAHHQLGLMYMAVQYYKRALEINNKLIEQYPTILDLRREIAYNLHLIYKNDSPDLARYYLEKYIII